MTANRTGLVVELWQQGYLPQPSGADLPAHVAQRLRGVIWDGWWLDAACTVGGTVDRAWWYASYPSRDSRRALEVCATCPVIQACAATALLTGEPHGIWGGLLPGNRRRLRAQLLGQAVA